MKNQFMHFVTGPLAVGAVLILAGCASSAHSIDTTKLTLVKENHATITAKGASYVLDSYIVPFQQPYYVKVTRADRNAMDITEAAEVAEQYIKPRGCTQPLSRRHNLDRFSSDKKEWLIGVAC